MAKGTVFFFDEVKPFFHLLHFLHHVKMRRDIPGFFCNIMYNRRWYILNMGGHIGSSLGISLLSPRYASAQI